MSMRDNMWLCDYTGTLCKGDTPVLYFDIQKRTLLDYKIYAEDLLPWTLKRFGISYYTINDYFKYRVVMPGAMWIEDYLHSLGLDYYDFEAIVKQTEGNNRIDNYHVVV